MGKTTVDLYFYEVAKTKHIPSTKENKTISDGGITVDFWFIKVHTSN